MISVLFPGGSSLTVGLLGRGHETQLLRRRLDALAAGQGGVIVLRGPGGIGKSAVLEWLAAEANAEGIFVLSGACTNEYGELPWLPISRALRAAVEDARLAAVLTPQLHGDLEPILRLEGETPEDDLPEARSTRDAALADDAFARLMARTAGRVPVLITIDDLQWADASTIRLLRWLIHQSRSVPVLVALSARAGDHAPLRADAAALLAEGERVDLGPLGSLDARRLILSAGSPQLDIDEVGRAVELAAGNPLYLLHLAGVLSSGPQRPAPDGGVGEIIKARIASMSGEIQDVLSWAAVMGETFELAVLAELADVSEDNLVDILQAGVRADFVRMTSSPSKMGWIHPLVREAVLQALLPARAQVLHRRVLELKSLGGADSAELAAHAEQSGEWQKCADYALAAATSAWNRGAFLEAAAHFDRTLRCVESGAIPVHPSIRERAARAWLACGRTSRAAEIFDELSDQRLAEGDLLGATDAAARSVRAETRPGSADRLEALLETLHSHGLESPFAMAAWVHAMAGGESRGNDKVRDVSERALVLARESGSDEALAVALLARGHLVANLVDFDQGCAMLEECVDVARRAQALREEHAAVVNLLSLYAKACRWDRGRDLGAEAVRRALEQGGHRRAGQLLGRLADIERLSGRWEVAAALLEDALVLTDPYDRQAERTAQNVRAALAADRQEWDVVVEVIEGELAKDSGERAFFPHGPNLALLGRGLAGRGDLLRALDVFEEVYQLWRRSADSFYGIQHCVWFTEALCEAGDMPRTGDILGRCHRRLASLPDSLAALPAAMLRLSEAKVALAEGRAADAYREAIEAAASLQKLAIPHLEANARVRAAEAALSGGGEERKLAREQLIEALSLFRRLGSTQAERCVELLKRERWAEPRARRGMFTPREVEIGELLSAGLTTAAIAERLVLSTRTVENHFSRMFAKAGVHTRAELIAVLNEDEREARQH
jgi:DNA-binding NarL/FixJ family response regulator